MTLRFKGNIGTKGTLKGKIIPTIIPTKFRYDAPSDLDNYVGVAPTYSDPAPAVHEARDDNGTDAWYIDGKTVNNGTTQANYIYNHISNGASGTDPITCEARIRNPFNSRYEIKQNGRAMGIHFGLTHIEDTWQGGNVAPMPADAATEYHTYKMVQDPGNSSANVYIDDVLVGTAGSFGVAGSTTTLSAMNNSEPFISHWSIDF